MTSALSEGWAAQRLYSPAGNHHLAVNELPDDGLAPLTKWAQAWIHARFHPPTDCKAVQYVQMHPHWGGMGAQAHVYSAVMAFALDLGAQLVFLHPPGSRESGAMPWCNRHSDSFCAHDDRSIQNWLRPLGKCALADVPPLAAQRDDEQVIDCYGGSAHHPARGNRHLNVGVPYCVFRASNASAPARFVNLRSRYDQSRPYNESVWLPRVLEEGLRRAAPAMSAYERRYWWRAQGVAYLLRFSERTLRRLAALRRSAAATAHRFPPGEGHPLSAASRAARAAAAGVAYDAAAVEVLPPGTLSAHVREGDKGMEQRPVEVQRYFAAARAAVQANPLGTGRLLFLSSENPLNLAALRNFSGREGRGYLSTTWYGVASDLPRHNSNGNVQGARFGVEAMVEQWCLQLLMALECDVFIGWRASNWNRLIDELRCVWVAKCAHPFYEVGSSDGKLYGGFAMPGQRDPNSDLDGVFSHIGYLGWR